MKFRHNVRTLPTIDTRESSIKKLTDSLGLQFNDGTLLEEALTHRSVKGSGANYERLEFLGDAVLGLVIAEALYRQHSDVEEGTLSRMRAHLVRGETLALVAREYSLGQYLRLGGSELTSGVFERDSVLADVVESIIGALYMDQGFDAARTFVLRLFDERLKAVSSDTRLLKDPKTRLQEALQARALALPEYTMLDSVGKSHEKIFTVECRIESLKLSASASATSRRKAEQAAAQELLRAIDLAP